MTAFTTPVVFDASYKGFPPAAPPCTRADVAARGWNVLAGDLSFPIAVLRDSALQHNILWMQDFASRRGVELAPHGKTSMSPELYRRQLDAGAWGLSFATVYQLGVGVAHGVRNAIIANQVVCDADLAGLHALLEKTPGLRVWFLVDSTAQIDLIEAWRLRTGVWRVFDCLLEIGIPGKRTGCRTHDSAIEVAARVAASQALRLGGIECYEGSLAVSEGEPDAEALASLMACVFDVAQTCDRLDFFAADEVLMTAGGSALFDFVAERLHPDLGRRVRGVLRSGCYVAHDHGYYQTQLKAAERRLACSGSLRPALEVWAMVQSCPEPGLALLTCGKRDISYDLDLPYVLHWSEGGSGRALQAPESWRVSALNDQHAYLVFPPNSSGPSVGDLIGLGISHPCTTFDKWRWLPVIDDAYRVVDAVTTHF